MIFHQISLIFFSIIGLNLIAWVIFLFLKNPAIIDVFWPISITAAATIYLSYGLTWIQVIFILLLLGWAVRLSLYLLLTRIIPGHRDKRYTELSKDWQFLKALRFLMNYQLQGLLAIIIATPFIFISQLTVFTWLTLFSIILFCIGLIGECIADYQLLQFKKDHSDQTCSIGLWQYSRHPNYFFEWLIWVSFFLAGLNTVISVIGIISPILLLFLMLKITIPLTEKMSLQSKPQAYTEYQKKVPIFFPVNPRKFHHD